MTDPRPAATRVGPGAPAVLMVRPARSAGIRETAASNRFQAARRSTAAMRARARRGRVRRARRRADARRASTVHAFADRADPAVPRRGVPQQLGQPARRRHGRAVPDAGARTGASSGASSWSPSSSAARRLSRRAAARPDAPRTARPLPRGHRQRRVRPRRRASPTPAFRRAPMRPCSTSCARRSATSPWRSTATDRGGVPVYHTNVVLSIGTAFARVCARRRSPTAQRGALLERLAAGGRRVLDHRSHARWAASPATCSSCAATGGARVLAASQCAHGEPAAGRARDAGGLRRPRSSPCRCRPSSALGGGSVRCMLAEVFLPALSTARRPPRGRRGTRPRGAGAGSRWCRRPRGRCSSPRRSPCGSSRRRATRRGGTSRSRRSAAPATPPGRAVPWSASAARRPRRTRASPPSRCA